MLKPKKREVMAVSEKEMEKMIDKYQKRADAAEEAYQETGMQRYYTTYCTNQDLADALRIALSAKEEHEILHDMKSVLSKFASKGAAATSPFSSEDEQVKLALTLAKELAEYGRRNGLI